MKKESLQYAKTALETAYNKIDEALVHIDDAENFGFQDWYQIQQFSRRARALLDAAGDGLSKALDKVV